MEKYYEQFPDGPLRDELKFRGLVCKGFKLVWSDMGQPVLIALTPSGVSAGDLAHFLIPSQNLASYTNTRYTQL